MKGTALRQLRKRCRGTAGSWHVAFKSHCLNMIISARFGNSRQLIYLIYIAEVRVLLIGHVAESSRVEILLRCTTSQQIGALLLLAFILPNKHVSEDNEEQCFDDIASQKRGNAQLIAWRLLRLVEEGASDVAGADANEDGSRYNHLLRLPSDITSNEGERKDE